MWEAMGTIGVTVLGNSSVDRQAKMLFIDNRGTISYRVHNQREYCFLPEALSYLLDKVCMLPQGPIGRFQWDMVHIPQQLNSRQSQVYTLVDDNGVNIQFSGNIFNINVRLMLDSWPRLPY